MNNIYVKDNKLNELYNHIDTLLKYEKGNMKLINNITKEFVKRGLPSNVPVMLFENELEISKLTEDELIAFVYCAYYYFVDSKDDKINNTALEYAFPYVKDLKPTIYFNDNKILQNKLLKPESNDIDEYITFNEFQQINEKEYQGIVSYKQLSMWRNERKIAYMKEIQRAYKIVTLPNGLTVKKENYNKAGLKDLVKRFKAKDIMTTQISLTIILDDGKSPEFEFIKNKNTQFTGDLIVKREFDRNKEDYAPLCINDGAHRYNAAADAYDTAKIDGNLSVMIRLLTIPEAKKLSDDSFKQNSTDKMYLETLNDSIENKYADKIIEMCDIWKNKIAKTSQEAKLDSIYGVYKDIVNTIKILPINTKSEIAMKLEAGKIGKTINDFINYVVEKHYSGDINSFAKDGLLYKTMCPTYVVLGFLLKNSTVDIIDMISDEFVNNRIKDCNVKDIYNHYKKILEE